MCVCVWEGGGGREKGGGEKEEEGNKYCSSKQLEHNVLRTTLRCVGGEGVEGVVVKERGDVQSL